MRRFIGALMLMLFAHSAHAIGFSDMFGAVAGRFNSYGTGQDAQAKQLDEVLRQVCDHMNKHMPEAIDKETRLDRVSSEPGPHFFYHYTLLESNSTDVDKTSFASTMRPQLRSKLCASPQIKNFFSHGISVSYVYQGKDGLPIGTADFAPNSCDNVTVSATKL
jgi:hypothetical protein